VIPQAPCKQPAGRWSTSRPANSQQEAHHDHPAHPFQPPRPQPPRRTRTAAAIAAIAALIATGGYLATTTIGPDAVDFPRFRGHLTAGPSGRPERMSVDAKDAAVFEGVPG
jgi:hypothetical protein